MVARGHAPTARSTTRSSASGLAALLLEDPDHADQRPAHAHRHAHRAARTSAIAALGATNKMFWSEMHREAMELALDIFGAGVDARRRRPGVGSWPAALRGQGRGGYQVSPMMSAFFFSRSETIWGGTVPDPAQHRRRAGPRPAEGAEGPEALDLRARARRARPSA